MSVRAEQGAARCLRLASKKGMETEFRAELANTGEMDSRSEWSPAVRPAWLLLEIEMDVRVREIQAKVAKRMEDPHENGLLQLNMGEGEQCIGIIYCK
jgi:hypothetical protein